MQSPDATSWSPDDHVRHFMYQDVAATLVRHYSRVPTLDVLRVLDFGSPWYGDPDGGWQTNMRWMLKAIVSFGAWVDHTLAQYPEHDIQRLDIPDDAYDVVIVDQVLEHVQRPWLAAGEMHRVLKRGGVAMCGTPGLYPVHPSPLDCWRILPDGYAALFPAQFWTTLTCGMWGDRERLMYELQDGGAFPDGPPETSVADAMKDATYREGCDGRFPIMVWWVGVKR